MQNDGKIWWNDKWYKAKFNSFVNFNSSKCTYIFICLIHVVVSRCSLNSSNLIQVQTFLLKLLQTSNTTGKHYVIVLTIWRREERPQLTPDRYSTMIENNTAWCTEVSRAGGNKYWASWIRCDRWIPVQNNYILN